MKKFKHTDQICVRSGQLNHKHEIVTKNADGNKEQMKVGARGNNSHYSQVFLEPFRRYVPRC